MTELEQISNGTIVLWVRGLLCVHTDGDEMHACQPTSSFADASNVVNLGCYRHAKQFRSLDSSRFRQRSALRPPENQRTDLWLGDDYREQMKVNAAVFVFLMFLITSGISLLDGISDSFGPERLSHQQNHDVGRGDDDAGGK